MRVHSLRGAINLRESEGILGIRIFAEKLLTQRI
jgi:hypothetical protein